MANAYVKSMAVLCLCAGSLAILRKPFSGTEIAPKIEEAFNHVTEAVQTWPRHISLSRDAVLAKINRRLELWETEALPKHNVRPILLTSSCVVMLTDLETKVNADKKHLLSKIIEDFVWLTDEFERVMEKEQLSSSDEHRTALDMGSVLQKILD